MQYVPTGNISQTFTMMTGGYDLNVPIPPAASSQNPSVVVFSFETVGQGVTTWSSMTTMAGNHGIGSTGTVTGFFDTQ